jgi:hypothetical protein
LSAVRLSLGFGTDGELVRSRRRGIMEPFWLVPAGWMLDLCRESMQSLIFSVVPGRPTNVNSDPDFASASALVLLGLVAFVFGKLAPRRS